MANLAESELNAVYTERNALVIAFATFAERAGYIIWTAKAPDAEGFTIIYVELPEGQVSWHIPNEELGKFTPDNYPAPGITWDGHTTELKYQRLKEFGRPIEDDQDNGYIWW